ncbi:MAG: phasin family protein [Lysobacterales bacterium]
MPYPHAIEHAAMTTPKFKKKTAGPEPKFDAQGKLLESAQQIWMAGLGAFSRAQDQGSKLFDALIREGQTIESKTRHFASGKADGVRDKMENTVSNVKERAADTWDRLEKVFEDRVSRALTRLGVPGREEMQALVDRVEQLNRNVRQQHAAPARPAAPAAGASGARAKAKSKPRAKAKPRTAAKATTTTKTKTKTKAASGTGGKPTRAPRKRPIAPS